MLFTLRGRFCYVNDVVLCIMHLQEHFDRVLYAAAQRAVYTPPLRFNSARAFSYIDVDVHHGDGVEQAFTYDRGVFSLSFHRHGAGFFPGTGDLPQMDESDDDADEDGERRSSSATLL